MRPGPLNVDDAPLFIQTVNNAIFIRQPIRVAAGQIPEQLLPLVWILRQDFEQNVLQLGFKFLVQELDILFGLLGEPDFPAGANSEPRTSSSG